MDGNVRWWRLLCLFMWLGQCLSMQPGLEYHYRYSGHLATGITEMRAQYSATGIKMDITVQVAEDYAFLIQFFDIQIGDYHDTLECYYPTSELPLTYSELQNGEEFLQRPFRITVDAVQNTGTLEVSRDEPLWITNVKKAVIDVFPVTTLWKEIQLGRGERFLRPHFGTEEELIGGRCMTWYSVTKLSDDEIARVEEKRLSQIEEDIQRKELMADRLTSAKGPGAGAKGPGAGAKGPAAGAKGPTAGAKGPAAAKGQKTSQGLGGAPLAEYSASVPAISSSLWKVVRTVDYDSCEEQLVTLKVNAPADTQKLIGRSSAARYLLRGDQRGIRFEKGVVDGSISLFTSSDVNDRIDTFTNQTVELVAVRRITRKISISYEVKRIRHWYFEFDHLTKRRTDGRHLTVEETLTGIKIPDNKFPELKKTILNVLTELYQDPKHLADVRRDISEAITYLTYSHIKEIYEEFESTIAGGSEDDQAEAKYSLYNFHLSLVISGTEPAFNYLLDRVSEEDFAEKTSPTDFLYKEGIIYLFEIGLKTIKEPKLVQRMVEFALAMNWDQYGSVNKAIALTSVASLAQKLCFSAERRRTYTDTTCRPEHLCNSAVVADAFLTYLQGKIQESANNVTTRVVYIQALVNLGLPKTLDILAPVIMGTSETDVGVRKIAIMALSSHILHQSSLSMVYELLMPLIENRGEHPEIRNVAFLALASWNPSISWWKHMAYFTWYEPNSQVSNFVASVIDKFAQKDHHMYETVSRVDHLVKPYIPSLTHSNVIYIYTLDVLKDFGVDNEIMWFASAEGLIPTQLTLRMISKSLYGFPIVTKWLVHQKGLSKFLVLMLERLFSKPSEGVQDQSIVEDMISESLAQLGLQRDVSTLWQYWQTVDDVFPTRGHAGNIINLAEELFNRGDDGYTSHFIWVDSTVALPTDLGLPIIIKHTEDSTIFEGVSEVGVDDGEFSRYKAIKGFDLLAGYSYSTSIRVKTLVPWSGKLTAVGAGIHSFSDALLPLTAYFGGTTKPGSHDTRKMEVVCKIQTSLEDPDTIIQVQNNPYTVTYATFPTQRVAEENEYKTVNKLDTEAFNSKGQFLAASGFHIEYSWESADASLQENSPLFMNPFTRTIPLHKTWDYQVVFDPTKSTASSITFFSEIVKLDWPSDSSDDLTQFSQQSQGQEDFADFSQFSQSASQDYDDFSQQSQGADLQDHPDDKRPTFADLSILSRFTSLRDKLSGHGEFGAIYGLGFALSLDGSESTEYIAELYVSRGTDLREYKNIILFMTKLGITGQKEPALFSGWSFQEPLFIPFITVEELLQSDLKTEMEGEVRLTLPGVESKAHIQVKHEVTDEYREQLPLICHPEDGDPALELLIYEVYDHITAKASWDEIFHLTFNLSNIVSRNFNIDNTEGENGHELEIDTKRDVTTGIYTIQAESPSAQPVVEVGRGSPVLYPGLFSYEASVYELINGRRSSYCTIKDGGVRTFDSVEFPAVSSNCWKIAAYDCYSGRAMFQVRKTEQWEARVLWKDEGIVIDITNSDIMVNGEPADDRDERYKVMRFDNALMVIFKTGAAIRVSDKVQIHAPAEIRSFPCGLCGNFDGEKASEMIGPKGCVYTDAELFSHAWSVSGDGCNAFSLRGHKQKIERYQQNCPKRTIIPTGVSHSDALSQCTSWQFINKVEGTWNCTSIIRTPKCKKGCVAHYTSPQPIPFDCHGIDGQFVEDGIQCRSRTMSSSIPRGCRKQ